MIFMTNRQKGVIKALERHWAGANIRPCVRHICANIRHYVRHIYANMRSQWVELILKYLVWAAVRSTTKIE